jgi:ABC-type molybdate transport system substrate-binding protein
MRVRTILLAILAMTGSAAAETVQLYAAGSLKAALTDVAKAYEAMTGNKIDAKYGPSGLLKNEISAGATAKTRSTRRHCTTRRRAVRCFASRTINSAHW